MSWEPHTPIASTNDSWGYGAIPSSAPSKTLVSLSSVTITQQPVHFTDFLELLHAFYLPNRPTWYDRAEDLWLWLTRTDRMFLNRQEVNFTATLAAWLARECCHKQGSSTLTRNNHKSTHFLGAISLCLSLSLCLSHTAMWMHQLKLSNWGIPDVCLLSRDPVGALVVIEAATTGGGAAAGGSEGGGTRPKSEQLYSYIGKFFELQKDESRNRDAATLFWKLPILGIQLYFQGASIRLSVAGYSQMHAIKKAAITPLITDQFISGSEDLIRFLSLLDRWSCLCIRRLEDKTFLPPKLKAGDVERKIALIDGIIWKVFDHRDRHRSVWRRDSRPNSRIPGAQVIVLLGSSDGDDDDDDDDGDSPPILSIVRYPFVPATDNPTAKHLADVLDDLDKLHREGMCHGDIRISNMVLCDDTTLESLPPWCVNPQQQALSTSTSTSTSTLNSTSTSTSIVTKSHLIDYDMAGKHQDRLYAPGYNHEIDDSHRHPEAQPGTPLSMAHDRFAMAWIMRSVVSESLEWNAICDQVERGSIDQAGEQQEEADMLSTTEWDRLDKKSLIETISRVNTLGGIARVIRACGLEQLPLTIKSGV